MIPRTSEKVNLKYVPHYDTDNRIVRRVGSLGRVVIPMEIRIQIYSFRISTALVMAPHHCLHCPPYIPPPVFHVKQRRLTLHSRGIGEAVVVKIIVIGHQQVELVQKRIRNQTGAGGVGHVGGGIEMVPAFAAVQADHVPPVIGGADLVGQAGDGQIGQAQLLEQQPGDGVEAVADRKSVV